MKNHTQEVVTNASSGWMMLGVTIGGFLAAVAIFIVGFLLPTIEKDGPQALEIGFLVISVLTVIVSSIVCNGFFTLKPNMSAVLTLFGDYKGTVMSAGFHWTNPFNQKEKVSLRSVNFNVPTLKVNDKRGNPIEIGAVVVWKVCNTAQAVFDVDDFRDFVVVQSESALRHLANIFPYDHAQDDPEGEVTLRSDMDEVSSELRQELTERLGKAGVVVEEARLSHLAYAPEIAGAMLRRQQAEAVISARRKIVDGAVSMVEMALKDLSDKDVVHLDEDKKATMVSNLLVVLCSENDTQPVINTGSLYS